MDSPIQSLALGAAFIAIAIAEGAALRNPESDASRRWIEGAHPFIGRAGSWISFFLSSGVGISLVVVALLAVL